MAAFVAAAETRDVRARVSGYRDVGSVVASGETPAASGHRRRGSNMTTRMVDSVVAAAALPASRRRRGPPGADPLRIGLAEDPDVLDPTLARTYVGRIVFASICDKLFDIDEKLNVVPQLALSHETSADGKAVTIKLRPGVKFHDGEPFDAEAAKYTLRAPPDLDRLVPQAGARRRSTRSRSSIRSTSGSP